MRRRTETVIYLADPVYADEVAMHFVAYAKEDVFKAWTEIFNREKSAITLEKYASSMLHMYATEILTLTQYNGDWPPRRAATRRSVYFGKKVIDTKLGARADMFCQPSSSCRSAARPLRERRGAGGHAGMDGQLQVYVRG